MTATLDGVSGLQDVPAAIYLRETHGNIFTGRWESPKVVWGWGRKFSFTLGFDSRPPSPCLVFMPTELTGANTHTHTHTHIYIYIYIYIYVCERVLKGLTIVAFGCNFNVGLYWSVLSIVLYGVSILLNIQPRPLHLKPQIVPRCKHVPSRFKNQSDYAANDASLLVLI